VSAAFLPAPPGCSPGAKKLDVATKMATEAYADLAKIKPF
jgi:hypothetical protein